MSHPNAFEILSYHGEAITTVVQSKIGFGLVSTISLSDSHKAICFQVRIARIFNTYGPRMCLDDGRVVSNFVAQVNV